MLKFFLHNIRKFKLLGLVLGLAFCSSTAYSEVCFLPSGGCESDRAVSDVYHPENSANCSQYSDFIYSSSKLANAKECHYCGSTWFCKCPNGASNIGGVCTCDVDNKIISNGSCIACPNGMQRLNATTCKCEDKYNYTPKEHEFCSSSCGSYYDKESCSCDAKFVYNGDKTKCLENCGSERTRQTDGSCKCIDDKRVWDENQSKCVCDPTKYTQQNGECVKTLPDCPTGKSYDSSTDTCKCPSSAPYESSDECQTALLGRQRTDNLNWWDMLQQKTTSALSEVAECLLPKAAYAANPFNNEYYTYGGNTEYSVENTEFTSSNTCTILHSCEFCEEKFLCKPTNQVPVNQVCIDGNGKSVPSTISLTRSQCSTICGYSLPGLFSSECSGQVDVTLQHEIAGAGKECHTDNGNCWYIRDKSDTNNDTTQCDTEEFSLTSCPENCGCDVCTDSSDHYRITSAASNYYISNNGKSCKRYLSLDMEIGYSIYHNQNAENLRENGPSVLAYIVLGGNENEADMLPDVDITPRINLTNYGQPYTNYEGQKCEEWGGISPTFHVNSVNLAYCLTHWQGTTWNKLIPGGSCGTTVQYLNNLGLNVIEPNETIYNMKFDFTFNTVLNFGEEVTDLATNLKCTDCVCKERYCNYLMPENGEYRSVLINVHQYKDDNRFDISSTYFCERN